MNKRNDRIEQNEGRKGKRRERVFVLCLAIVIIAQVVGKIGISTFSKIFDFGDPYTVVIDDIEIKPGKITLQELANAGYEFAYPLGGGVLTADGELNITYSVYDLTKEAEGNTTYPSASSMLKDGKKIGTVSIVNRDTSPAPLSECYICDITINGDDLVTENIVIEGIEVKKLTIEKITETLGKSPKVSETQNCYTWSRGDYRLRIYLDDDGSLKSISSMHTEY